MEREQAVRLTQNLLRKMVEKEGSDLFITTGFPPAIKVDGTIHKASDEPLSPDQSAMMVRSIMNDKQIREFDATKECNFAITPSARLSSKAMSGPCSAPLPQRFRRWTGWNFRQSLKMSSLTSEACVSSLAVPAPVSRQPLPQ